jgi:hypothetical protein
MFFLFEASIEMEKFLFSISFMCFSMEKGLKTFFAIASALVRAQLTF